MSVFVDASVLVALLVREDDWPEWSLRIDAASEALTSPVAMWEAIRAVQRITKTPYAEVDRQLRETMAEFGVKIVAITDREGRIAVHAHECFGKSNHPAKLNMGDCFAYACAKTHNARLFYKGDDFAKTDLA